MIERLIEWSAQNRFLVALATLLIVAWGVWAVLNVPLDAIPDLSDVQVIVLSEWSGRSPDLVEDQVTYPVVSALLSAPQVKVVRGMSFFGLSFVYVIFEDGTDLYWARSRVLEYISEVTGALPEGVVPKIGPDATGVGWAFEYALVDRSGNLDLADLRSLNDWHVRYWLESVPGVAEVASVGGQVRQYQVSLDPNTLAAYRVPVDVIVAAIQASNADVGGRTVELAGTEYMVRGRGYIRSLDDLRNIAIGSSASGTPLTLGQVARVGLGPEMRRGIAELDGNGEVVGGIVVVRSGENALAVIERVKQRIAEASASLPAGVEFVTTYDRSDLIRGAIANLGKKLVEESLIVALVCVVFLFHLRSALVAIVTLPVAILMAFIAMVHLGVDSNLMSLGGIAIAIGAMIDAAIVMVENAHKKLERWSEMPEASRPPRSRVIVEAAKQVGKPLFFSLLIITVSFLPVFTLEAQEGRLFRPLALTKTFAMLFASVVSVTLVPLLMLLLIRGRVAPEHRNPIARLLIWLYRPFATLALRFRWLTVLLAIAAVGASWPAWSRLGSEFMPPLWEGSLMYMPTTLPGVSATEITRLMQTQNRLLRTVPEVERVFGKAGRAETATDPAPMMMIETVITLRPRDQWRPGMTPELLEAEMDELLRLPGVVNSWTMPIKGRIDMLSTGIRTPVGVKVFGSDLQSIEAAAAQVEAVLSDLPGTRNVVAERVLGGYYLDFDVRREEAARLGLNVGDVEMLVETAIGGRNVTQTVEGRERYPVNVRYARELRDTPEDLGRVLVPTPRGAQVPIGQLADIRLSSGAPMLKSEDGQLVGYVLVDVAGIDLGAYVRAARKAVDDRVQLPAGVRLQWSGQFEYLQRAQARLVLVVPLTLVLILLLLYLNFGNVSQALIVMLSVPFAAVGAVWMLWWLQYNLSVAVWVGIIALAGLAAETGVVMIVYLDEAYHEERQAGRLTGMPALLEAALRGSVQRVRPKMMTVGSTMLGLLPIFWGEGPGSDTVKRIAAPMVGGMVSSTVLTLLVIPAIYVIWRGWQHRRDFRRQEA